MVVTPELLKTFSVLKPFPVSTLTKLAGQSTFRRYVRRSIVQKAGERDGHVCFLFEGRLQGVDFTLDGREVGLYFVEKGDFCGELAVFDHEPQPEHVIALAPSEVVLIPAREIRDAMVGSPQVMAILTSRLAFKLRQMTVQRSILSLPNVAQRVCYQLCLLADHEEKRQANDRRTAVEISSPPTQKELAIMLNLSRETVTRVFQNLQSKRIVRRDGPSKLIIVNPESLRQLAEGLTEL